MEQSFRFFNNNKCQYFPCHKGIERSEFNCLFCYCPLYFFEDCGGNPKYVATYIKDCSNCHLAHVPEGFDIILARLKKGIGQEGRLQLECKATE